MTNQRLRILLYNAIVLLEQNEFNSFSSMLEELGMTEAEYNSIMGDKSVAVLGVSEEEILAMHDTDIIGELEFWEEKDPTLTRETIYNIIKEAIGRECYSLRQMMKEFNLLGDDGEEFDECLLNIVNTIEKEWSINRV